MKMILFLKNKLKIKKPVIITGFLLLSAYFIYLFIQSYLEKKSLTNELNKNQIKDCEAREKNKCNDERIVCNLKDKKEYKKCEYEFNACVEVAYSNCEKKYQL